VQQEPLQGFNVLFLWILIYYITFNGFLQLLLEVYNTHAYHVSIS